ncbi:hypothetical protein VTO73DRAFT_56 [Trametes versicolor]
MAASDSSDCFCPAPWPRSIQIFRCAGSVGALCPRYADFHSNWAISRRQGRAIGPEQVPSVQNFDGEGHLSLDDWQGCAPAPTPNEHTRAGDPSLPRRRVQQKTTLKPEVQKHPCAHGQLCRNTPRTPSPRTSRGLRTAAAPSSSIPAAANVRPPMYFRWKPSASALFVHPARHTQFNLHTYVEYNTYMGICTDAPTNLVTGGGAQIGTSPKYGASRIIEPLLSALDQQRSRIEPQTASEVGCPPRRSTWARGHVLAGFAHAYVTVGGRAGRLPAPVAPRSSDHPRRAPSFHFALSPESARASRTGTRPAGAPIPRPSASGTTDSSHSSGRSPATAGFVLAERS